MNKDHNNISKLYEHINVPYFYFFTTCSNNGRKKEMVGNESILINHLGGDWNALCELILPNKPKDIQGVLVITQDEWAAGRGTDQNQVQHVLELVSNDTGDQQY